MHATLLSQHPDSRTYKLLQAMFVAQLLVLVILWPRIANAQDQANGGPGTVRDKGNLKVADLRFDNFLGIVSTNLEVKSGDEAGMKFFVEGFSREEHIDSEGRPEFRVSLKYSIDIRDIDDRPLQPIKTGQIETTLGLKDDGWRWPVEWSVKIPDTAPTGRYAVLVTVVDSIGQQTIQEEAALRVRGLNLKTSGSFEIFGVEFAPSDNGPWRPIWYFEPRAPIYVRYKIAGFSAGAENQIHVEQDWTVLDAEGKEVISQTDAITNESQAFYLPRYVQNNFSVSLRDPKPGDYRLRIDAQDKIGAQHTSSEARFVLRP